MTWNKAIASAYIQHRVRERLGPNPPHGAVAAFAREVGVLPQTISQLSSGVRGIGPENFDKFAEFWGRSHDQLMAEASAWVREHPEAVETRVEYEPGEARAPAFGLLPGYAEAEAEARRGWRGQRIPEGAWVRVRELAGAKMPTPTKDRVLSLAEMFAEELAEKPQTPDELAHEEAEEARLEKLREDVETAKKKREGDAEPPPVKKGKR